MGRYERLNWTRPTPRLKRKKSLGIWDLSNSDQLKQLVELHKAAEQAMKGFIVRMLLGDALPNSYFGLVR